MILDEPSFIDQRYRSSTTKIIHPPMRTTAIRRDFILNSGTIIKERSLSTVIASV